MSNVAAFILAYPELSQKALRQVLFMGGALEEPGNSNSHRSAEWSVVCPIHHHLC